MAASYQDLGPFSDWVAAARTYRPLYPSAPPGEETRQRVRDLLGFGVGDEAPIDVRSEQTWERDGVAGEAVSWSVGYGPRTEAWVLKPAGASGRLPGVVALHDHGGFKFYGKEKIADGCDDPPAVMTAFRARYYGGRAYANALARAGFVVLVHDTFLWGSRRFPLETMPERIRDLVAASRTLWATDENVPEEIAEYNAAAGHHEHLVEKYCTQLGTTLAGVVGYEDRVAVNYLRSRPDVREDRVACLGLSGGGNRAALLMATCDGIAAAGIVGLMSTYEHLLDHNIMSHTWMFFPHGWAREGDWPDLAASRAPAPLLVQYDLDDQLFTPQGMQAGHERIAAHYRDAGAPDAYTGTFYPGPHKFDRKMQDAAFAWLETHLA
jgi:dienelactone hydrolase